MREKSDENNNERKVEELRFHLLLLSKSSRHHVYHNCILTALTHRKFSKLCEKTALRSSFFCILPLNQGVRLLLL